VLTNRDTAHPVLLLILEDQLAEAQRIDTELQDTGDSARPAPT